MFKLLLCKSKMQLSNFGKVEESYFFWFVYTFQRVFVPLPVVNVSKNDTNNEGN